MTQRAPTRWIPLIVMALAGPAAAGAADLQPQTVAAFDRYDIGNRNARSEGRPLPFAEVDVENRRGLYLAAEASLEAAKSKLVEAQFNLDQTSVYAPTAQSLSRQIESFAAAELACVRDIAARTRMSASRVNERLARCYQRHARGAVHSRNLPVARRFALASLRHRVSAAQLWALALACTPRPVLDLQRRARAALTSRTP